MIKNILLIILVLIHALLLHFFGISWIGTTLLFYYIVYLILRFLLLKIPFQKVGKLLLKNVQVLIICLVLIECAFSFYYALTQNVGIAKIFHFSEQKRKEKLMLYNFIFRKANKKEVRLEGYPPFSSRKVNSSEYNYIHSYDENGFRNKKNLTDSNATYSIVLLGDSFIEGDGTSDDSTISQLMNDKFRLLHSPLRVYNAGISGSNPIDEITLYKQRIEPLHLGEEYIVLLMCFNDEHDVYLKHSSFKYLENISTIYFIIRSWKDDIHQRKNEVNRMKNELAAFKNYVEKKGKKLKVVYIPSLESILSNFREFPYSTVYPPDVDFYSLFQHQYGKEKLSVKENHLLHYYYSNDAHYKPKGYRFVADTLANYLLNLEQQPNDVRP